MPPPPRVRTVYSTEGGRVCAKCGRSEKDDPNLEFRVCDCQEKCHGRLTEYCIEHARAH